MDELKRLGGIAVERLRQAAEDIFNQAFLALLPLIEQLIQHLTVLWEVLRLLAELLLLCWLRVALGQAMEPLAEGIAKGVERMISLVVLGLLVWWGVTALALILVAVLLHRASRRACDGG